MADGITDEMLRAGTAAMWGSPERNAAKIARMVLEAALVGRVAIKLPEPDSTYGDNNDPAWTVSGDIPVTAYVGEYGPTVDLPDGTPFTPEAAEEYALAFLAAARVARRMAGETSTKSAGGVL